MWGRGEQGGESPRLFPIIPFLPAGFRSRIPAREGGRALGRGLIPGLSGSDKPERVRGRRCGLREPPELVPIAPRPSCGSPGSFPALLRPQQQKSRGKNKTLYSRNSAKREQKIALFLSFFLPFFLSFPEGFWVFAEASSVLGASGLVSSSTIRK